MLITRENIYAIRMVRALADNDVRPVREICDGEGIPHKWAYKILKKMERAGIVKAFYGVKGGYQLDKEISKITMLDILSINESDLLISNNRHDLHTSKCAINGEVIRLDDVIRSELRERTLDKVI